MAAPTTPEEAIEQAALGPKSVTVDGTTVTARDIKDLKEADQYSKPETTVANIFRRSAQMISPGANR